MPSAMPMTREQTLAMTLDFAAQAIATSDPRAVLESLLHASGEVARIIQLAGRMTPADVAQAYGQALVDALAAPEVEQPKIQLLNGHG